MPGVEKTGWEEAQVLASGQPGELLLCKGSEVGGRGFEVEMGPDWGGGVGFWSRLDGILSPWAPSGVYVTTLVSLWSSS